MKNFRIESVSTLRNAGQAAEQDYRFHFTGEIVKPDNLPHDKGGDFGLVQIKSARATVCKGINFAAYLAEDPCTAFAYVTKEREVYEMTRAEYTEFVKRFGTVTRESAKNGGAEKIRLKSESRELLNWLATR